VSADDDGRRREQVRTAAMMRGAAEALAVLSHRAPAEVRQASEYATGLLCRNAGQSDWAAAGLPVPVRVPETAGHAIPVSHDAAVHLAEAAMDLHCAGLHPAQRPARWARLEEFLSGQVRPAVRARLRARADAAQVDADDVTSEVVSSLVAALEQHQAADGPDAYLTGMARRSLATAYRRRRTGTDLTNAATLAADDTRAREARYGPEHPVTLDARSLLALYLLAQAESAPAEQERRDLATRALGEITTVRAAQDRRRGVASPDSVASHRREARALLLLGEVAKARASMDFARRLESGAGEA
jgi:DNA-directed RNA polymerase specialized sigma24 family protein